MLHVNQIMSIVPASARGSALRICTGILRRLTRSTQQIWLILQRQPLVSYSRCIVDMPVMTDWTVDTPIFIDRRRR